MKQRGGTQVSKSGKLAIEIEDDYYIDLKTLKSENFFIIFPKI